MNILELVFSNIRRKPVTLHFPKKVPTPLKFRGLVKLDTTKCIGCEICAYVCPDKSIEINGSQHYYEWSYNPGRCTFCERCINYCPVSALNMETEPAPSYKLRDELKQVHRMQYPVCPECGQAALPVSETLMIQTFNQITDEMREWIRLCERCRRRRYQKILKNSFQGVNNSCGH